MTSPIREQEPPRQRGAVEELASDPASRKRFLKMLGGGGAATVSFGLLLSACGGGGGGGNETSKGPAEAAPSAPPPKPAADVDIVNYALMLEYVESDFYRRVIQMGLFSGARLDLLKAFGDQELQHVEALTNTVAQLGGTPVAKPRTRFTLGSPAAAATLAATVENLGAAAYLGQAGNIKSKEVLAAALSIHTVEARHAAALNRLTGRSPTPQGAFAKPATMAQVLPRVKPFIVS